MAAADAADVNGSALPVDGNGPVDGAKTGGTTAVALAAGLAPLKANGVVNGLAIEIVG